MAKMFRRKAWGLANPNVTPVFIVGCGRSGNTLLRRYLMEQGYIYIPPETYVLARVIESWKRGNRLPWEERLQLVFGRFATSEGIGTFPTSNLRNAYLRSQKIEPSNRNLGAVINEIYKELERFSGLGPCGQWGDKTPLNTLNIESISETFPNAFFVHLVRNPWDVVASYVKMGRFGDLESAAKRWNDSHERCCELRKRLQGDRFFRIDYEKFVQDPVVWTHKVLDFAHVEKRKIPITVSAESLGDVELLSHHSRVTDKVEEKNIGKGFRAMSKSDRERVASLCSRYIKALSIAEPAASNGADDEGEME